MVLKLASLEKKKKKKKKKKEEKIFVFFKIRFLGFYKAERKLEEIFVLRRVRASIDIHFVELELSYDVLSPLPIVLSKHFNHPHPYIEIATAISDRPPAIFSFCTTVPYVVVEVNARYKQMLKCELLQKLMTPVREKIAFLKIAFERKSPKFTGITMLFMPTITYFYHYGKGRFTI